MPYDQNRDHDLLWQEIEKLQKAFQLLADANPIPDILINGFDKVTAQLETLRDLTPQKVPMKDDQPARLQSLRNSLARLEWGDVATLKIVDQPPKFIGDVAPPPRQAAGGKDYIKAERAAS